ncbi:DUF4012 domain-containing protein, partial [Patescibacteria group bacterium]|nr:DUF4012 domain-containing protein [Patescibacteria group bacterium]
MTKWMNRKGVYGHGNFGVEKTDGKSADLMLSKKQKPAGRVVDLSRQQPGVFLAVEEKRVKQKRGLVKFASLATGRGRKKKTIIEQAAEPEIKLTELFKKISLNWSRYAEPLEISHPKRAEILARLEEIETINNSLKNQTWLDEEKEDLEALEAALDLPGIVDVEKYLWLPETPLPKKEADILEKMLAEPDLEMIDSGIDMVIVNSPTPTFSPSQREGESQRGWDAENENTTTKEKLIFEQFDFLTRWRRKKNQLEEVALISARSPSLRPGRLALLGRRAGLGVSGRASRKFWGRKGTNVTGHSRVKFASLVTRQAAGFLSAGFMIYLVIFGMSLAGQGLLAKENILSSALQAYKSMLAAKDSAANLNFDAAGVNFDAAYQNFLAADQELNKMGRGIIYVLEKLPGGSVVGSGAALVEAGENLAKAGQSFAQIGDLFLAQKIGDYFSGNGPSLTQKIIQVQGEIAKAQTALAAADKSLAHVNAGDLPTDLALQVEELKNKITPAVVAINQIKNWSNVFLEFLGHERAKKYLLIFQNNSEARATGGFIGTYGVADIDEGQLKNLFIDGIFNLDGQLYEKVIPPRPIQKISTAWSTHDANWFADFPASAKKVMSFYEAAGGATTDGVISLTPTVIERLLTLTGPIDLPQYGVALDQNNFLDVTQYKVEKDYDKQLNQPKKILADFAPLFLDRLWQIWPDKGEAIVKILADALAEKHILFYFTDPALAKAFVEQGWAGEILSTEKDYLSVINTNINGFKTDKVIDQKIYHTANVQADGSIIDTVKIARSHLGGKSQYDWYNKVN